MLMLMKILEIRQREILKKDLLKIVSMQRNLFENYMSGNCTNINSGKKTSLGFILKLVSII